MGKEALGKVSPPPQPFPRPSLRFVPSAYFPQCSFPSKNKRQRKAKCLTGLAYWVSLLPPSHSFLLYLIHSLWCWRLLVCSWVFVCFSCGKLNRDPLFKQVAVMGRLPFSPKFRKFWLEIKWNGPFRFGPTGIFEGGLKVVYFDRSAHFGRSDRNVPLHLTKVFSAVPLFCILLTRPIDLFNLLVFFFQYRSCVNTLENCFFQIL